MVQILKLLKVNLVANYSDNQPNVMACINKQGSILHTPYLYSTYHFNSIPPLSCSKTGICCALREADFSKMKMVHRQKQCRGPPGVEPGTSRTQSENHTTRPRSPNGCSREAQQCI